SIFPALPKKEDVLNIVFHDGAGLIGLAVETRSIAFGLGYAVGDLVPEDWCQAVEAHASRSHLDIRVQRHDVVPAALLPRDAHVTDDATDPTAGNEDARALAPYLVELGEERFIVLDVAHLPLAVLVLLQ